MNIHLSERMREARLELGMTQVELARETGRTQAYISKFEKGQLRLDVSDFIIFTKVLKIDGHALLDELVKERPDMKVIPRYSPPLPRLPDEATNWTGKEFLEWMGEVNKWVDENTPIPKPGSRPPKPKSKRKP
jgi:transcriptional regulator with XRE-family HTH domain